MDEVLDAQINTVRGEWMKVIQSEWRNETDRDWHGESMNDAYSTMKEGPIETSEWRAMKSLEGECCNAGLLNNTRECERIYAGSLKWSVVQSWKPVTHRGVFVAHRDTHVFKQQRTKRPRILPWKFIKHNEQILYNLAASSSSAIDKVHWRKTDFPNTLEFSLSAVNLLQTAPADYLSNLAYRSVHLCSPWLLFPSLGSHSIIPTVHIYYQFCA